MLRYVCHRTTGNMFGVTRGLDPSSGCTTSPPRLVDRAPGGTHRLLGALMLKQGSSSNLCRKWGAEGVSKRPSRATGNEGRSQHHWSEQHQGPSSGDTSQHHLVDHREDRESSVKAANQGMASRCPAQDNLLDAAL